MVNEEIKSGLDVNNAWLHSVHKLLSSRLLTQKISVKMYKIYEIYKIYFACILYERETWSLTLREEHILRVFENMVLRIFGP
jgi:hypothetical protein